MKINRFFIVLMFLLPLFGCGDGSGYVASNDPETNLGNLPADPGDAGKLTLEGVDSDNDGIRDDVQIAIYERYPDDERSRSALEQNAKAIQEAILAGDLSSSDAINQASILIINGVDCLHERVNDPSSEIGFLEQKVVNTTDRSDAYIKFNEGLNGQFFGGDDSQNPCQ